MQILKTELCEIISLRGEYLKSIPVFQDYFLELMIEEAYCYLIQKESRQIGYAVKTADNILIEFYLIDNEINYAQEIFNFVVKELSVKSIYCKSYDSLLLNLCTRSILNYKVLGALYRDYKKTEISINNTMQYRFADESDLDFLMEQGDETFEPKHKIPFYIQNKNIIMFYENGSLAGCGFISQINRDWNYYDLGVWVSPEFRKQGIGSQIILSLKNICSEKGYIPICGCDINNKASQKTLEKCGFISKYSLLEFFCQS